MGDIIAELEYSDDIILERAWKCFHCFAISMRNLQIAKPSNKYDLVQFIPMDEDI